MGFEILQEMSRLESRYIYVPVIAKDPITGATIDPTGDEVVVTCYTDIALPDSPAWVAAAWATIPPASDGDDPQYFARALIAPSGAGTIQVAAGPRWWGFAQVDDNPQIPICRTTESFRVL